MPHELSIALCDHDLVPLPNIEGPITNITAARIVLTELDQFSSHEITVGGEDRRALMLLQPFNTVKIYEQGIGLIALGVIHDPTQQITATGDTITVTLMNITDQLSQYSVGLGASYTNAIGEIVAQLGATPPTGETITLYSGTTIIGYVTYSGNTVTVSDPQGEPQLVFPGSPGPVAVQDERHVTVCYAAATALGIAVADLTGGIIGTYYPTYETTGWSASMVDDVSSGTPPTTASAAPVAWESTTGNLTIAGNNVKKNTGTTSAYDAITTVPISQQITQLANAAGAAIRADASLQWYAPDATSAYRAGLTTPGTGIVAYGFEVAAGTPPAGSGPTIGSWSIREGAAVIAPSGVNLTFQTGDAFEIRIDQSVPGTPQVKYYVRGGIVYVSSIPPVLPYAPLAMIASPGGGIDNAILTRTVLPSQAWWEVQYEQATPLEAILQLGKTSGNHVRQGVRTLGIDAGGPAQTLEFGLFGQQSGIRLMSAQGADATAMAANADVRVVTALTYQRQSRSKGINTITPLGANNAENPVDLERCWRLVNDRAYPYYGKVGPDIPGTVFPEYDDARYPIKRRVTRAKGWEYYVRDVQAFAALGMEVRGRYSDPQFAEVDSTSANQEATARALYVATTAKLANESKPLETMSVQTVGAFRPPRAGSKVVMDFRRIGNDAVGNFSVMDTAAVAALATPFVLKVEATYSDGARMDDWTLTNLGIHPGDANAQDTASSLRDLEAIKIMSTNSTTFRSFPGQSDVDATHPLVVDVDIPVETFRIKRVEIRVVSEYFRQQVKTAEGGNHVHTVKMPDHDHAPASGLQSDKAPIAKAFKHRHKFPIRRALGTGAPTASSSWLEVLVAGAAATIQAYNSGGGEVTTSVDFITDDLEPTSHPHPISGVDVGGHKKVAAKITIPDFSTDLVTAPVLNNDGTLSLADATTDDSIMTLADDGSINAKFASTVTEAAGTHIHQILPELHDVTRCALIGLEIDGGDGGLIERSSALVDQGSQQVGPWTDSFYVYDASKFFTGRPGRTARVRAYSLATSGNVGLGHLRMLVTLVLEIGGVGSQAFKA